NQITRSLNLPNLLRIAHQGKLSSRLAAPTDGKALLRDIATKSSHGSISEREESVVRCIGQHTDADLRETIAPNEITRAAITRQQAIRSGHIYSAFQIACQYPFSLWENLPRPKITARTRFAQPLCATGTGEWIKAFTDLKR